MNENARSSRSRPTAELKADFARISHESATAWTMFRRAMGDRDFMPVYTLRHCQYWENAAGPGRIVRGLWRLAHRIACHRAGIVLPATVRIGAGLRLAHVNGLYVDADTVIGEGATLSKGVAIINGSFFGHEDRHAEIGHDVFVGSNAVIGPVRIGNGVFIAPLASVLSDVASGALVTATKAEVRPLDGSRKTPDLR